MRRTGWGLGGGRLKLRGGNGKVRGLDGTGGWRMRACVDGWILGRLDFTERSIGRGFGSLETEAAGERGLREGGNW